MTTSRIVRGTKGRIFVYICSILIVTGIIACYNNTRIELENVQKSNDLCHQQQEHLSTQLQVISDYKQRLEKSLKTVKAEHQQAKAELESRVNEEKLKCQKASNEAILKFNSLQQHYRLVQTQHDDLKEECSKKQKEQLDIINNLQAKLKEIQGQLKQSERERENSLEHLKSQIEQLKVEKSNLENQVKEISKREDVQRQNIELKDQNNENQETLQAPNTLDTESAKPNFTKQVLVDGSDYKISGNNVGELPPSISEDQNNINQVENAVKPENPDQVVLPLPNKLQSSTPNSNLKSSKASLEAAPPLKVPTVTPETSKNKTSERTNNNNPEPIPSPSKKLPDGVVAIQDLPEEEEKLQNSKGENEAESNLVNNRYRNVEHENEGEKSLKEKAIDLPDKENAANEIFEGLNEDANINVDGKHDEQKNHFVEDYEHLQQNDETEDDDGDDYGNHNNLPKDPAIRN